jgi:hypothetical protein
MPTQTTKLTITPRNGSTLIASLVRTQKLDFRTVNQRSHEPGRLLALSWPIGD